MVLKVFSSLNNSVILCSLLALTVLDESEEMNTCVWQAKLDQMHTDLALRLYILRLVPFRGSVLVLKGGHSNLLAFYGNSLLFAGRLPV